MRMPDKKTLGIHIVCLHIGIDPLTVPLLVALNVVEKLAAGGLGKLKHAGIVEPRDVLLGGQKIAAQIGIL